MNRTATLQRLVSTSHGQRRILKHLPSVVKYIRQAVESGTYPPNPEEKERENKPYGTNFRDYPIEYEILSLFPPLPPPPRIPKKFRQERNSRSNQALPTDRLVKEYLKRMKDQKDLSEEEYYDRLLGINPPKPTTAMGRKSALLNKAYAFALKQYQIMRQDIGITEQESIAIVEDLLAKEKKTERFTSRSHANQVKQWRQQQPSRETSEPGAPLYQDPSSAPSILHSKPRAIEGMTMWSKRLRAVPYKEWTIGATTALDHWVARSVLNLEEDTWQELLEGDNPSLLAHGRDILTVRQSLFPETILEEQEQQPQPQERPREDMSVDKSIDELLASLGGFDDYEDKDAFWPSETTVDDGDMDQKVSSLIDELQKWRAKNMDSPYDEWSAADKDEFAAWLDNYVMTLSSNREAQVDMIATRKALLSSPPLDKDESDKFWRQVRDETDAEILLQSMRKKGAPSPQGYTGVKRKAREAFELFQRLPYEVQLQKLVDLGTLRPIMDEYTSESERIKFLARYGEKLMEGVEMEHLVPDPEGPIRGEELGKWGEENGIGKDERFRMSMVKYGTDEFGTGSSDRARELYHAWNTHKAGRARFEEIMFKSGRLGLRYNLDKEKKATRR